MELINLWIPVFLWILIGIVLVLMISDKILELVDKMLAAIEDGPEDGNVHT